MDYKWLVLSHIISQKTEQVKKLFTDEFETQVRSRKFEYEKIANIKIIESFRFSPRIPINSFAS